MERGNLVEKGELWCRRGRGKKMKKGKGKDEKLKSRCKRKMVKR